MLGCLHLAMRTVQDTLGGQDINPLYMSLLMDSTASMMLQYLDSVLLSRWTYQAQGPDSALGG